MPLTIPNVLTLLRLAVIPLVLGLFYVDWPHGREAAAILFATWRIQRPSSSAGSRCRIVALRSSTKAISPSSM